MQTVDVIIIGAGPAGGCCASLLQEASLNTLIIEKSSFPRFSIGESFLPQNMSFLQEAKLDHIFDLEQFQPKNGAEFLKGDQTQEILFADKFTPGPSTTFQVHRDRFDQLLAKEVQKKGSSILFEHQIETVDFRKDSAHPVLLTVINLKENSRHKLQAKFIVDASGFAKVLPKLLGTKIEKTEQNRRSYFTHVKTSKKASFDHNKILITVDQNDDKNWFWTIPLQGGTYSLGLITEDDCSHLQSSDVLNKYINSNPKFKNSLGELSPQFQTKKLQGYTSKTVKKYDKYYVLIGNSGEFTDPIFSSGITVALKTASLAAKVIIKNLQTPGQESIDWEKEYEEELSYGTTTFKAFIESWYSGDLQDIIFSKKMETKIRSMIISILAGYAWDKNNPYTKNTSRRLKALAEICRLAP